MPLVAKSLESKIYAEIKASLAKHFKSGSPQAEAQDKFALAIAEAVAKVVVAEIQSSAMVLPGIPTAGSPPAHTSVGPGKIL